MNDQKVQQMLVSRARSRYGWHCQVLRDARTVGMVLCGDSAVTAATRKHFDTGIALFDFMDPCLCSLLESLIDWRRHTEVGKLPVAVSPCPSVGQVIPLIDVSDYLQVIGMWGEHSEYEHPTQVSDSGREFLDIAPMLSLPGWTTGRLTELYALGYEEGK